MKLITRSILVALAASVLAWGLGSCGGGDNGASGGSGGGYAGGSGSGSGGSPGGGGDAAAPRAQGKDGGRGQQGAPATVTMREYEFSPKAVTVRAGEALTVVNDGEIAHNLTIEREGTAQGTDDMLAGTGSFLPGRRVRLPVTLASGRTYLMVCTVPGHRDLGMTGKLRVR